MADLAQTSANVRRSLAATLGDVSECGESALVAGDVVYLDLNDLDGRGNPKAKLADANDTLAKAAAVGIMLHPTVIGQPAVFATFDSDFLFGATLVPGLQYILSSNPGKVAPVTDLVSGWYYTPLFVAKSTTLAVLNPAPSGFQR